MLVTSASVIAQSTYDWTPYIVVVLGVILAGVTAHFQYTNVSLSKLNAQIAVLIEHNIGSDGAIRELKKHHDELIDHKIALSSLDQRVRAWERDTGNRRSRG